MIEKILNEINRLKKELKGYSASEALDYIEAYINTLSKESANEDLEEEITNFFSDWLLDSTQYKKLTNIARHFAEWQEKKKNTVQSCKKLYDVIKQNQEKKFFNDDFEKAAYAQGMIDCSMLQKYQIKELLQTEYEKGRFDMREEMMKDAVGGVIHHFADDEVAAVHYDDPKGTPMSMYVSSKGLSAGDKVKIIIVKEKEEK